MPALDRVFVDVSGRKLQQLAGRIDDCLGRLSNEQVWARQGEHENAIGNLVLHLCGNVRQWIGSGIGGKPDVRVRDREFAARGDIEVSELRERLKATVEDAASIINSLSAERLLETVTIQSYQVTVMEAVYHVIEHFAQHTGQIIFATKRITQSDLGYYRHLTASTQHSHKTP